jgi:hypothetical protein
MKFLNLIHWSASIAHQVINRATNCATPSQPLKEPQKTVDYKQGEVRRAAKGQVITAPLLLKLKTFAAKQHIPNELLVCPAKQP